MLPDFSTEYRQRNDDELLELATERHSLAAEAAAALDAELRRRNVTESDRVQHQKFKKRQEQREARKHRRKTFGPFKYQMSWREILWAFAIVAMISLTYVALPSRFHFIQPEWQDAAFIAMMTSVIIAIACKSVFWRTTLFWVSLLISSATHLVVVHALTQRVGSFGRGRGKGAAVLGFLLFVAIFAFLRLLQRLFNNEEILTPDRGGGHIPE